MSDQTELERHASSISAVTPPCLLAYVLYPLLPMLHTRLRINAEGLLAQQCPTSDSKTPNTDIGQATVTSPMAFERFLGETRKKQDCMSRAFCKVQRPVVVKGPII